MSQTKAQLLDPQGDFTLTGQLIGVGATFSGNVSIAGTLTKQDVTNVDSVGLITARSGIKVTSGNILLTGGNNTKVSFAGDGSAHYIKMDTTLNGPVINGYGGIAFETAGANERLRINSNGQVSIRGTNTAFDTTGDLNSLQLYYEQDSGQGSIGPYSNGGSTHLSFYTNAGGAAATEKLRITSTGQVAIGTVTGETNYLTTINGDLSLGEKNGTSNTFIDQKQDGDLHLINSGRSAQGGSGSPGVAGVGINRYNNISGDTTKFRDFAVYNGKDTKILVVDGSAGLVGIATDAPADAFLDIASTAGTEAIRMRRLSSDVNVASNWAFKAYGKNLYFREGSSSPYDRVHFTDTGNVVATGTISDSKGNLRSIPRNGQGSAYSLVASDAGKAVGCTANVTVTTALAQGDAVTIINENNADITIVQGSGLTLYNASAGVNAAGGDRTLSPRGVCTVYYTASTAAYISGSGLS